MRLIPIAEVLKMDIGEKVPATKGKIKNVYDINKGENDKGLWSIQNVTLCDPDNPKVELRVKLFNQNEIPKAWKGRQLYIESAQGEKGIKHVSMAQDTYKWKEGQPVKKQLEVRDDAVVGLADNVAAGKPASEPTAATPASTREASQTPQPAQPAAQGAPKKEVVPGSIEDQANCVRKARASLGRAINGLELCIDAALHLNQRVKGKHKDFAGFAPPEIEKIAVHLSISLERGDLRDGLPTGSLDKVFEFIESQKKSSPANGNR